MDLDQLNCLLKHKFSSSRALSTVSSKHVNDLINCFKEAFSQRAASGNESGATSGESSLTARRSAIRRSPRGQILGMNIRFSAVDRSRPPSTAADRAATDGNALKVESISTLRAFSPVTARSAALCERSIQNPCCRLWARSAASG